MSFVANWLRLRLRRKPTAVGLIVFGMVGAVVGGILSRTVVHLTGAEDPAKLAIQVMVYSGTAVVVYAVLPEGLAQSRRLDH
jgi:uncharacterized membrane protein YeaQ/YmgE (transglycosylase-associated protein family)